MKKSSTPVLLLSLLISVLSSANEPLKVGVASSFLPVLETIKPRLVQQLGVPLEITAEKNIDLYDNHLKQRSTAYDLIIFSENQSLASPIFNQQLLKKTEIIISPQVVLWCPRLNMPKRISLNDIITQVNIHTIAAPGPSSLLTDTFVKTIYKLPGSIQLVNTSNSLTAWRMANTQQVDCAITLDKWLKPTDQFNYISTEPINFRGWINGKGKYGSQSKQIISILSSPLLQPLMIRATHSDTTQNMK